MQIRTIRAGKGLRRPWLRVVTLPFKTVWGVLGVMGGPIGVFASIGLVVAAFDSKNGSIPLGVPLAVTIACADLAVIIVWGRGWYRALRRAEAAEIQRENAREALAGKNAELERSRERWEGLVSAATIASWGSGMQPTIALDTAPKKLRYLANIDQELEWAVLQMSYRSAWGKWFAARQLALDGKVNQTLLLSAATSAVEDAAVDGRIALRGRLPLQITYEPIPREAWRLAAIVPQFDQGKQDWVIRVIPRHGVDPKRIADLLSYESLIVNAREFETVWPESHERIDAARTQLLAQAAERGADPEAIERIRIT